MNKSDTFSIKYIYGELDPSEEILFEREIKENSDLMIEVESLKKTKQRLNGVPVIQPPDHLTKKVLEFSDNHRNGQARGQSLLYFSFAASVLVVIFFGYLFALNEEHENSAGVASSSIGDNETVLIQKRPDNRANEVSLSPWVDKNDILHVNDFYNNSNMNASFDSVFRTSMQKLTPVLPLEQNSMKNRELQLTGSNK